MVYLLNIWPSLTAALVSSSVLSPFQLLVAVSSLHCEGKASHVKVCATSCWLIFLTTEQMEFVLVAVFGFAGVERCVVSSKWESEGLTW